MKKFVVSMLAVIMLLLSAGFSFAAEGSPKINLTMTSLYMESHPVVQQVYLPLLAAVKEKTGGQVEITYHNPNTICPDGEVFNAVQKGQVHIGSHLVGRNPGQLNVSSIVNIPSAASSAKAASAAFWKLYSTTPAITKEFGEIHVITMHSSAPSQIAMVNSQIKTMADLKGKKILVAGQDSARMLRALGADPVNVSVPEFYTSLKEGVALGCNIPITPMRSYNINEVTRYTTIAGISTGGIWLGMNKSTWDSLPESAKQVFTEMGGANMSKRIGALLDNADQSEMKALEAQGHVFYTLPSAERFKWIELVRPQVTEAWLKEKMLKANMMDAAAIYQNYTKFAQEAEAEYSAK